MDMFIYEDDMENGRKLATIEASINRTLLYDGEKKDASFKNNCKCLIYLLAGSIIAVVVIVMIIVLKTIKN